MDVVPVVPPTIELLRNLVSTILFAVSLSLSQTEYDFVILFFALLFSLDKILEPSDKKLSHSSSIHAILMGI